VVAIIRYRSRVKATGEIAETPLVHVFTIQGGKVTRFFEMFDTAKAERAYRMAAAAAR
jgi:ketosteroid isomerase-like protein